MKILTINGAPRQSGVTNKFLELFLRGAKKHADVHEIKLGAKKISPCLGCYACARNARCVIDDDMEEILAQVCACDILACFTPLYFFSMSAQMKAFFDRCFPIVAECRVNAGQGSQKKKMLSFTVGSGRMTSFESVAKNFEMIATDLDFELVANIRRGEAVYFSGFDSDSLRVKKILKATERVGEEVALQGRVSDETLAELEMFLAPDDETFVKRSKVYWRGLLGK